MKNQQETLNWERAVILELSREHARVCRERKIFLRLANIRMIDSETVWGHYDSLTRTISMSRKLIHHFSWFQVLGVFRHEMAHQYVSEGGVQSFRHERPHGEQFQAACKKLGIPPQFARSGIHLQSSDLDWRTEKQDPETERILEKIRKLLALANSTNEHEALLAMSRVREIYAKHNLEQMENRSKEGFVHQVIPTYKKRMEAWELKILSILIAYFFVKVLTLEQFEAQSGEKKQAFEIIGTRENVMMAEYVYHFLRQQVQFLVETGALPGRKKLSRSERNSYRLGILDGFARKLSETMAPQHSAAGPVHPNSLLVRKALVQFHKDPVLADYLAEIYPKLAQRRASSTVVDGQAFAAGHQAGSSITLKKPITESRGSFGGFLTTSK